MNKRRLNNKKFDRALSRRGELTGKPGNFLLTSSLIALGGKAIGAAVGAGVGANAKEDAEQDKKDVLREQGIAYQGQQDIMDTQHSNNILSTYNPQGDAQMYARYGAKMYQEGGKAPIYQTENTPGSKYTSNEVPEMEGYYRDAMTKQWGEGNLQSYVANAAEMTGVSPREFAAAMIQEGWHPDRFANEGQFTQYSKETGEPLKGNTPEGGLSSYYAIGLDTVGDYAKEIGAKTGYKPSDYTYVGLQNEQDDNVTAMYSSDYQQMINSAAGLYKYQSELVGNIAEEEGIELTDEQRQYFNYMGYNTQHNSPYIKDNETGKPGVAGSSVRRMMKDYKKKGYLDNEGDDWANVIRTSEKNPDGTNKKDAEGNNIAYNPYAGTGNAGLYENAGNAYRRISKLEGAYDKVVPDDPAHVTEGLGSSARSVAPGFEQGGYTPYPYQDQPRTTINPTLMYNNKNYKNGGTLLERVQTGNTKNYWPSLQNPIQANNPGNVMKHRDNMDHRYPGSSQNFQQGGTLLERVQTGNTKNYWPSLQNPIAANNPGNVMKHRDNMDHRYPGSSQNFQVGGSLRPTSAEAYGQRPLGIPELGMESNRPSSQQKYGGTGFNENPNYIPQQEYLQDGIELDPAMLDTGNSMFEQLQNVGMQDYQQYQGGGSYQDGGAAQVPGGQIEQMTDRGQVAKGNNPELIDDIELGTNPGEPDAVIDHNEVMVDAVDEQGQPYKQIFSDTVLVPGKNTSMAKEAKKYLKQMPEDEESEQAQLLYKKLGDLFNVQQMMNGDSHGESAEEASAGGMDPNAAAQMQGQGAFQQGGYVGASQTGMPEGLSGQEKSRWSGLNKRRMQNGGAGYPSAAYDAGLREQQMQVPYPRKNYQDGGVGIMEGIMSGIGGAAQGFTPGMTAGYAMTPDMYGETNPMMAAGSMAGLASGMPQQIASHSQQVNQQKLDFATEQKNKSDEWNQTQAQFPTQGMWIEDNPGIGYSQEPTAQLQGIVGYQEGGVMIAEGPMGGMMIMMEPQLPNTLADLQSYAKPANWGHLDQDVNTLRRNSNLMGRVHRGPKHDGSAMVSGSQKGGPTPKKKQMRNGGRLYYSFLNKRSLTLGIL